MPQLPVLTGKPEIITIPNSERDKNELFQQLKQHLLRGKLIGLPTETVYGLASNGLDTSAIELIFHMKKRPMNDPIILHVFDFSVAINEIFSLDLFETEIVQLLSDKFTPGPLTIVAKAKDYIPKVLSNNTGYQGVRVPSHSLTREFLRYLKLPLAAPSANVFGHISPTTAQHVLNEFPQEEIYIISGGPSSIGIESTVVKLCLIDDVYTLSICRPGAITFSMICDALSSIKGLKIIPNERLFFNDDNQHLYSPGQLLTHYSPKYATYLLKHNNTDLGCFKIQSSVLFDICGVFANSADSFTHYIKPIESVTFNTNLSMEDAGTIRMLQQGLFANLRRSEELASKLTNPTIFISWFPKTHLSEALYDRIYR